MMNSLLCPYIRLHRIKQRDYVWRISATASYKICTSQFILGRRWQSCGRVLRVITFMTTAAIILVIEMRAVENGFF